MNPDNPYPENSSSYEEGVIAQERNDSPETGTPQPERKLTITKIADIQRMNIDQLNLFGKKIGLKHLGSLTKSQMVFEIVKAISENPNEVLYGEGVLEILPDGFGFL